MYSITQLHHEDEYVEADGSILRGVCFSFGAWRSSLVIGHGVKHLGFYETKCKAGRAYDRAAKYYYGSDAKLNYPHAIEEEEIVEVKLEVVEEVEEEELEEEVDEMSEGTSNETSSETNEADPPKPLDSKGYYIATSSLTYDKKLSEEVLDMKQRRSRQMVGKWQPPVLGITHQADIGGNNEPANVKSEVNRKREQMHSTVCVDFVYL